MRETRIQIDQDGRFTLPVKIRKEYNIKPGAVFILKKIGEEMRMISLNKAVENAQNTVRQYVPVGVSLVDEMLQAKREELALERKKFDRQ